MPQNTKSEPLLSEQSLFTDVKQTSNSKIFVSNTIKDKLKIEYYNDNEICAGVIKSIVPKYHLRSCPELRSSLKFSLLIQIMRCNFSEKDSSSMLTEMSNLVQSVNDSTYDFVATPRFLPLFLLLYRFLSLNKLLVTVELLVSNKLSPQKFSEMPELYCYEIKMYSLFCLWI